MRRALYLLLPNTTKGVQHPRLLRFKLRISHGMPTCGMPNHLLFDLQEHGHLSRISALRATGHSRGEIDRAIAQDNVFRVTRDWIGTASASQTAAVAVGRGGKLTGASALASSGIWDAVDLRIYVALRPNAHGTGIQLLVPIGRFSPPRFPPSGVELRWRRELTADLNQPPWRVSIIDALALVEAESPPDQFVACVDSALHVGKLSQAGLPCSFRNCLKEHNPCSP
jgi:hypothetical protein